ncbi:MAG: hypothetical protein WC306_03655, partial [Candidatus Paceibacterota bacterium]|jgi:hypothetical protein
LLFNDIGKEIGSTDTLEGLLVHLLSGIYGNSEIVKSKEFAFFAVTILNIARLVDEKYFNTGLVKRDGASIRNLMLIGALDYLGIIYKNKEAYSFDPAIGTNDSQQRADYQLAIDLLAAMSGIEHGKVMLSHYAPGTV